MIFLSLLALIALHVVVEERLGSAYKAALWQSVPFSVESCS